MHFFSLDLARKALLPALVLGFSTLAACPAHAQANLTFTGGSGTPLAVTLTSPVSFIITTLPVTPTSGILFAFQGVGNPFPGAASTTVQTSGQITFRVNNGPTLFLTVFDSGVAAGAIAANDLFFYGANPSVAVGDTITLVVGTSTTTTNVASARPANGSFTTFLFDGSGNRISTNGVSGAITAAPEPGTVALVAMGLMGTAGMVIRRRK